MITDKQLRGRDWCIVLMCIIIPLFSFCYMDTHSIIRCGTDVFRSIFAGYEQERQYYLNYDYEGIFAE